MGESDEFKSEINVAATEGFIHIGANDPIFSFRIALSKGLERLNFKAVSLPFAFNSQGRSGRASRQNKIHLMAPFIAPVANLMKPSSRCDFIQGEMFPQITVVGGT